ncbi:MAG: BMP family ABC transporter substrate-binding protein [Lachnospiraceae bacterium]|nr:BMP family ABC transporter substrate-binding protein [Lachnospiraceae bacterium]
MKMRKILCLILALVMVASMAACGSDSKQPADSEAASGESTAPSGDEGSASADLSSIKVGAIVNVVKGDGGWCQAQYEGLTTAMKNLGMDVDSQLIFLENIAEEQSSVQAAVDQLVNEGCNIIFGASTGYAPILSELAPSYPDVKFAQAGDKVDNIVGYQIRDYEAMFLCGYTMGLLSDSDQMGYSAGMSEASVRRGINAFALGAKAARENATVQVMWANSWYDIAAETECANTLINMGIKYIGINASSPAIPEACQAAGVYCTGYHMDIKERAPKSVVTSFIWNWAPIMEDIITKCAEGTLSTDDYYFWGSDKDCAKIAPINTDIVSDQTVIDKVAEMQDKITKGEYQVFAGELKDNKGNVLVNEGEVMSDQDILSQMFLVENVIGEW